MKTINLLLVGFFSIAALAIIGDTIRDPATLALLIPIVLIVAFSPIGKAIGNLINGRPNYSDDDLQSLKIRHQQLENKLNSYEKEIEHLRESVVLYDNKKIDMQKKTNISLEKNI